MIIFDLINLTLNAGACSPEDCPGSVFNSITAALATQGYYKQADLLEYFVNGGLGSLASLVYAVSAFAGIIAMVIGAPPRNYVWFFIGPALYHFLIGSHLPASGVRWMNMNGKIAKQDNDEVWRLAQAGLYNNGYIIDKNITVTPTAQPSAPAQVSNFFLWTDYFFSSVIEQMIPLTGIYTLRAGTAGAVNIDQKAPESGITKNWSILTDLKWTKIEDITSAQLSSPHIRDAFSTFLSSECGDGFTEQIDDSLWIQASKGKGKNIPWTVFKDDGTKANGIGGSAMLAQNLAQRAIPLPDSITTLLKSGKSLENGKAGASPSSFLASAPVLQGYLADIEDTQRFSGAITCDKFLNIIIHAFKYQAINIYGQFFGDGPGEFAEDPNAVVYNLLYGWGIGDLKPAGMSFGNEDIKRQEYLVNLIFVYLLRNEMAITAKPKYFAKNASAETQDYVDTQIKTIGSKTKYAEVYSWAKMMPWFQGIMLYILAMAYPFCALMVLVPGWHKIIVTWMTFWVWTKSWDLGFAVVKVLERSIWSMMGNDPMAKAVNERVLRINEFLPYKASCAIPSGGVLGNCDVTKVEFSGANQGMELTINSFKAFGRALGLAGNLELDLTNSYYVYIMAALYFAVPGVAGQIILGAKSGAANLVGGMVQGLGDKASGAAGSGSQAKLAGAVQSNAASIGQTSYAKAMRQSGLATSAIEQQNMAADMGRGSSALNTKSQLASTAVGAMERRNQSLASQTSPIESGGIYDGARVKAVSGVAGLMGMFDGKGGEGASAPGGGGGGGGGYVSGRGTNGKGAAGSGSAAGGAGGGAPGGGLVMPNADASKQIGGALQPHDRKALSAIAELKNRTAQPVMDANNEVSAVGSDRQLGSFMAQNKQSQAQSHGQRLQGYANFAGETAAAKAAGDFANQAGAYTNIAAGVMGGSLVKQKPMATPDSAMSGLLGGYAKGQSNYFQAGGGFSQKLDGNFNEMVPMAGQAVRNAYDGGHDSSVVTSLKESDYTPKDVSHLTK